MPGISGAARLVKSAATSKTTKTAVKKAVKSDLVQTAVSGVVVDAALPEIKDRVAQRLNTDQEEQTVEENEEFTPEDIGNWNEPTMLGLNSDLYARYLQNQILVLSEYENYIEEYKSSDFEDHIDAFYTQCEDPEIQLQAAQLVANSVDKYKEYLENYAVRNDNFRDYVLNGPKEPTIDENIFSYNSDIRESAEQAEEYIEKCNHYLNYLTDYAEKDQQFASHVSSYGSLITGEIKDLESTIVAELQYLSYLQQYVENDEEFRDYIEAFSPEGEAYYSLVETENRLLKNSQDDNST